MTTGASAAIVAGEQRIEEEQTAQCFLARQGRRRGNRPDAPPHGDVIKKAGAGLIGVVLAFTIGGVVADVHHQWSPRPHPCRLIGTALIDLFGIFNAQGELLALCFNGKGGNFAKRFQQEILLHHVGRPAHVIPA